MTETMTQQEAFHKHLEQCPRCDQNPFDLCDIGSALLSGATIELHHCAVFADAERKEKRG